MSSGFHEYNYVSLCKLLEQYSYHSPPIELYLIETFIFCLVQTINTKIDSPPAFNYKTLQIFLQWLVITYNKLWKYGSTVDFRNDYNGF